jgi:hypothetical protein
MFRRLRNFNRVDLDAITEAHRHFGEALASTLELAVTEGCVVAVVADEIAISGSADQLARFGKALGSATKSWEKDFGQVHDRGETISAESPKSP